MEDFSLAETALFQGIAPTEIGGMLRYLHAIRKKYKKGELIYAAGDIVQTVGVVLLGSVTIEQDDLWGNKSILSQITPGQIFAETYACIPEEPLMVNVVADEATEVLFLHVGEILQGCSACAQHQKLVRNLLAIVAQKNLHLSQHILHTAAKSIRGRLISYFSFQATKQGGNVVVVPFNRQQLADYLGVDRSALCHELSKMQRDGLLVIQKNTFTLQEKMM